MRISSCVLGREVHPRATRFEYLFATFEKMSKL